MEKLKHRFMLPNFRPGDKIQCKDLRVEPLPVTFARFQKHCNTTGGYQAQCCCPTNGWVLVTQQGYNHCIFSGKSSTTRYPYGTPMWTLIERKRQEPEQLPGDST